MSFIAAAIIGGGALAGGIISAAGAHSAANAQAGAANSATAAQLQMYNQTRNDQAPWRQAGQTALGAIMGGFGLPGSGTGTTSTGATGGTGNALDRGGSSMVPGAPGASGGAGDSSGGVPLGYFSHQFDANDLTANLAPNYGFMLGQGQGAVTNLANVTGGLSGNTFKALNDYTQNYASGAYQQAYTNYTANQTNIFNRLASISGLGQTASSNAATGGSTYAGGIAGTMQGAGNAQAAGIVGQANAGSSAIGSIANYYAAQNLANINSGNAPG